MRSTKQEMYEKATEILKAKGHTLLEPSIDHYRQKLNIVDDKGRPYVQTWESLKTGYGSKYEKQQAQVARNLKYTIQDLVAYAESKGGKCLSTVYTTDLDKYEWQDHEGFIWKAPWKSIKKGIWSPNLKRKTISKSRTKYNIEYCRELAALYGGKCLSDEYDTKTGIVMWEDREGTIFCRAVTRVVQMGDLLHFEKSHQEAAILQFVEGLGLPAVRNCRSVLAGNKEIDVYVPSKKVGIEYHGLKWHTEKTENTTTECKYELAKEAGIELFQVFEHEWKERQPQVKSFIRSKLGANDYKVGARSCDMRPVPKAEARKFLYDYHIKGGRCEIKHAWGLYYKNELVMLTTFAPHHRTRSEMTLNRCVSKYNWTVAGGLSRLCKYAKAQIGPFSTWVDLCWSSGASWLKAGWVLDSYVDRSYLYYNPTTKKVKSKQSMKSKAGKKEAELAEGFERVFDAGKVKLKY